MRIAIVLFLSLSSASLMMGQKYLEMIDQGSFKLSEIQFEAEKYFEEKGKGRGSGYKQFKRWEYNARINQDRDGYIPSAQSSFENSVEYNRQLNNQLLSNSNSCTGDWKELGPKDYQVTSGYNPGIGRITSVCANPTDSDHIIIGAQSGGVWETMDGGENWTALTDDLSCIEVWALNMNPSDPNHYYWGGRDGLILESRDRGKTWTSISIPEAGLILSIKNHPSNGDLFACSSYGGLFRLSEGEEEWIQIIDEGCYDIEFHPENDSLVYTSGYGMWISEDGGKNFQIADSLFYGKGVVMMAVSEQAPDHLYALQEELGLFDGLYISRDKGKTFDTLQNNERNYFGYNMNANDDVGQAPRDMDIVVSNVDTSLIYIGGINLWRSTDGGSEFEIASHWLYYDSMPVGYNHADIDMLLWHDEKLLIASDGGIFIMEDPTSEISNGIIKDLSFGLGIQQFYRIGVLQSEDGIVAGGSQDNGSNIYKDDQWFHWIGADGMETFFFQDEQSTVLFGTWQYGGLSISEDLGETSYGVPGLNDLQGTGNWITPFIKDAENENIYVSYDAVYRSNDFGFNFDTISQVLNLEHLVCAPSGNDTLYGAAVTNLYRTTDGGATDWELITNFEDRNIWWIEAMAVHPRDANLIALAVQGFSSVIISRDGGDSWEDYGDGLPDFPSRTLVWQDDEFETLYVGTNFGVYRRDNSEMQWMPFSFGMPNAIVNDLQINTVTNELYAATYGRGLWVTPLCSQEVGVEDVLDEGLVSIRSSLINIGQPIDIITEEILDANIGVFRMDGQTIYSDSNVRLSDQKSINTSNWSSGLYILRIESSKGYRVFKIVLQ